MEIITVRLKDMVLDVRLVERRKHSVLVKLPEGNVIVRKNKDVINQKQGE